MPGGRGKAARAPGGLGLAASKGGYGIINVQLAAVIYTNIRGVTITKKHEYEGMSPLAKKIVEGLIQAVDYANGKSVPGSRVTVVYKEADTNEKQPTR